MAELPEGMPMSAQAAARLRRGGPVHPLSFWIVVEDTVIWAAFTSHDAAVNFRVREFAEEAPVCVLEVKVYRYLSEAPTTIDDDLQEAAAW
jgi:hypothetical protein